MVRVLQQLQLPTGYPQVTVHLDHEAHSPCVQPEVAHAQPL